MNKIMKTLSAAAIATAVIIPAQSAFAGYTKLGVLDCKIADSYGKVFGSKSKVSCTFRQSDGKRERYTGSIGTVGVDLGKTKNASMKWLVFKVKDKNLSSYALRGSYFGASAGGSLGKGMSANYLVGGNFRSIGLQPVSLQTQDGLNLKFGVSGLRLKPSK